MRGEDQGLSVEFIKDKDLPYDELKKNYIKNDYANDGGDYIKLLDWLEFMNIVDDSFSFHIHSMNPVGVQNMRNIIEHNGWRYV